MKVTIKDIEVGEHYANQIYTLWVHGELENGDKIKIFVERPMLEIRHYINKEVECLISAFELSNFNEEDETHITSPFMNRIEGIYLSNHIINARWLEYINDIHYEDYFHAIKVSNNVILLDPKELEMINVEKGELTNFKVEGFELRSWYNINNLAVNKLPKTLKIPEELIEDVRRKQDLVDMDNREEIDKVTDIDHLPPSHFSKVGIIFTPDLNKSLMINIVKTGIIYSVPAPLRGYYFVKEYGNGIEFWIAINKKHYIEAGTPYFRSKNENVLSLSKPIQNKDWRYEGGFSASLIRAENSDDLKIQKKDKKDIAFQFVLDVPDYALIKNVDLSKLYKYSITAFADSINFYKSAKELQKSRPFFGQSVSKKPITTKVFNPKTKKTKSIKINPTVATHSFIPVGSFQDLPRPKAFFTGQIKSIKKELNPNTKLSFYVINVESYEIILDIVADCKKIPNNLKPNSYFSCEAWIIGHLIEDFDKQFLISDPEECNQIRSGILNNFRDFDPINKDPNPYQD